MTDFGPHVQENRTYVRGNSGVSIEIMKVGINDPRFARF